VATVIYTNTLKPWIAVVWSGIWNLIRACAELVAACTIRLADVHGLPVSTTHVLSSGVAGTMAANHSGLQKSTLRNLVLAWVLTLPVCMFLGAALFAFGLLIIFRVPDWH
jgi:PiT family inorganic phosphate transporter